ncbi:unnamed protein product [Bursaphelenchus xylophilus]|uniref:(pine wood nematode) hypothetical protein n=1 Tax=Bursaphelenchus xylophilus TaxID=6326 RepID=A0A1I7ST28_BURXY|nr:unnamed protein product [Bursaphelenchus xylophilus]CAG9108773.1 unnamed protein product [Bursaphelenchus xylophilus]
MLMFISLVFSLFPSTNPSAFQCSSESHDDYLLHQNSVASAFRALDKMFVFEWPCKCEYDWRDMFCSRLSAYKVVNKRMAPSVCICRQLDNKKDCSQFLTRCFESRKTRRVNECDCCFKQPDEYCHQLDCRKMKPDFGENVNVSCLCYTQENYPDFLCGQAKKSTRENMYSRQQQPSKWPFKEKITFVGPTEPSKELIVDRPGAPQKAENPLFVPLAIAGSVAIVFVVIFAIAVLVIHRRTHRPVDFEPSDLRNPIPLESSLRIRQMNGDKFRIADETELHPLNSKRKEPQKIFM